MLFERVGSRRSISANRTPKTIRYYFDNLISVVCCCDFGGAEVLTIRVIILKLIILDRSAARKFPMSRIASVRCECVR